MAANDLRDRRRDHGPRDDRGGTERPGPPPASQALRWSALAKGQGRRCGAVAQRKNTNSGAPLVWGARNRQKGNQAQAVCRLNRVPCGAARRSRSWSVSRTRAIPHLWNCTRSIGSFVTTTLRRKATCELSMRVAKITCTRRNGLRQWSCLGGSEHLSYVDRPAFSPHNSAVERRSLVLIRPRVINGSI